MGQAISNPLHSIADRKSTRKHLRDRESRQSRMSSSANQWRRSSMGGRLRSFAVALQLAPSPVARSNSNADENIRHASFGYASVGAPSPVRNDVISVRQQRRPLLGAMPTNDLFDAFEATTAALERAVAAAAASASTSGATAAPRASILSAPMTPSSIASSCTSSSIRAPSINGNADVARFQGTSPAAAASPKTATLSSSNLKIMTDQIGASLSVVTMTATPFNGSSSSGSNNTNVSIKNTSQIGYRLPRLRVHELEQIFSAIVTSTDVRANAKFALCSDAGPCEAAV